VIYPLEIMIQEKLELKEELVTKEDQEAKEVNTLNRIQEILLPTEKCQVFKI
jgi:hypothetical protein